MTDHKPEFPTETDVLDAEDAAGLACVLSFNANDPSGAGGITADITAIASVGAHALPITTGAYARDTAEVYDHFCMDDEAVTEQARAMVGAGTEPTKKNLGKIKSLRVCHFSSIEQ